MPLVKIIERVMVPLVPPVAVMLAFSLAAVAGAGSPGKTPDDSTLIFLRGVPDDAVVSVNDTPVTLVPSGPLLVPAGSIQISVSAEKTSIVKSFFMRGGDRRVLNFSHNPDYSTISIISDPPGAEVYLDDEKKGTTPMLDPSLIPGTYTLMIRKNDYDPVEKRINLLPQEELELTFDLNRSRAWRDSVASAAKVRREQRRFMQRVVCASLGIVFSGAASYFNWDAQKNLDHAEALSAAYEEAREGFDGIRSEYHLSRDRAVADMQRRDLLLGLTAASAIGFSLSFLF
ncbi:MAG: PEGA domain-containing protein [Chitinispirillaceae bacterium]|nr:PEGA domain-containing protein [Chitinispirillaceae bacterium]